MIQSQRTRIDNYINNLTTVIQEKTEQLLDDAEWVENNLESGETGRQIIDDVDRYMRQYGVWEWVDPNDESKGRIIKTSAIEQTVDSIDSRVGAVETYKDGALATALSNISQTVGVDLATGQTIANTGLTSSVADLNAETGAIDRAIIAALDLKAEKQNGTLEAITDLASVYSDNTKSLYSGLNQRVRTAENSLSSEVALMSRIANDNGQIKTDALAGFLASTEFSSGVEIATSTMSSSIGNVTAAIETKVSKDSNGKIESGVTISADSIYLNGDTFAGTIFSDFIKTSKVEADYAKISDLNAERVKITTLEANDVTITGALSAASATFSGKLVGATGSFNGEVSATKFRAGDVNGLNITTTADSFNFNWKDQTLAWFSLNDLSSGTQFDTTNGTAHGFYLYMMDPGGSGNVLTINFGQTSPTIGYLGSQYLPVVTRTFYTIDTASGTKFTQGTKDWYSVTDNGTTTYYNRSDYKSSGASTLTTYSDGSYTAKYYEYGDGVSSGSQDYKYVIYKKNGNYYLTNYTEYQLVKFENGTKSNGSGAGSKIYAIYDQDYRSFVYVKSQGSSDTISNPNSTIYSSDTHNALTLEQMGESLYMFSGNSSITVTPVVACTYSDAEAVTSGSFSTFNEDWSGNHLVQYDYSFNF